MNNISERKGISLVALIITIIVLIILTGAVIMTMNKGDTIGKSKEAVFKSDMTNYREEVSRNILNEQVKGNVASMKDVTVLPEDLDYETEIKKYIPNITSDYMGKLGIVEGNLYYVDKEDEEKFGLAAELNMINIADTLVDQIEIGDYIRYTAGANLQEEERRYIATASNTGMDYDQTFTVDGTTEENWRVLSVDEGKVSIVKDIIPGVTLSLYGDTGYNNAETVLNGVCSIYGNATQTIGARSIKKEDIDRVTGYEGFYTVEEELNDKKFTMLFRKHSGSMYWYANCYNIDGNPEVGFVSYNNLCIYALRGNKR